MTGNDYSSSNSTKTDMSDPSKERWKDTRTAKGLGAAGSSLSQSGKDESDRASQDRVSPTPYGFKRGGKVRKTGPAVVHRGERVIPRGKVKRVEKLMRKNKIRMKASGR